MSCRRTSRTSHGWMRSSKGLAKGEALMACVLTMWSSRRICASSTGPPPRMYDPVAFQSLSSKASSPQSSTILSSIFSILHSRLAKSLSSSIFAMCWSTLRSSSRARLVVPSGSRVKPTRSVISFQWRWRSPGLQIAEMSGMYSLNFSIFSLVATATLNGAGSSAAPPAPANILVSLNTLRYMSLTISSTSSGLSLEKGPFIHSP
mmetsp:Transcript_66595/g.210845  ORF Transcript_66595/g.210845 Transcript_66595/m.210845 type:complete len:205 (-) Transcript_66595:2710-3324(-)